MTRWLSAVCNIYVYDGQRRDFLTGIGFTGNTAKDYEIHPAVLALKRVKGHRVAEVLSEIVRTVREEDEKVIITADGGVRTGFDFVKIVSPLRYYGNLAISIYWHVAPFY